MQTYGQTIAIRVLNVESNAYVFDNDVISDRYTCKHVPPGGSGCGVTVLQYTLVFGLGLGWQATVAPAWLTVNV